MPAIVAGAVFFAVRALLALFLLLHLIPGDPATIALGPRATPEVVARYGARVGADYFALVGPWKRTYVKSAVISRGTFMSEKS